MSLYEEFVTTENEELFFKKVNKALGKSKAYTINALREYSRFMRIIATSKCVQSPSKVLDVVWHEHFGFTKDYAAYCQRVNGSFIHHKPSEGEEASLFEGTLRDYEIIFNTQPPAEIWFYSNLLERVQYEYNMFMFKLFAGKKKKKPGGSCSSCSSCSSCTND